MPESLKLYCNRDFQNVDVDSMDHDQVQQLVETFREVVQTQVIPFLEISNKSNFYDYHHTTRTANLVGDMQKKIAYDLRAHRFVTTFLPFTCYASQQAKLQALAQAVKIGGKLLPFERVWRVQYTESNRDVSICFAYFEQRVKENALALPFRAYAYHQYVYNGDPVLKSPKNFGEYGMHIVTNKRWNNDHKPVLRNILIELEPLIRSTMAVAFACVTHPRLGMNSPLVVLEPAIVRRIFELADYYGPLLRCFGPSPSDA